MWLIVFGIVSFIAIITVYLTIALTNKNVTKSVTKSVWNSKVSILFLTILFMLTTAISSGTLLSFYNISDKHDQMVVEQRASQFSVNDVREDLFQPREKHKINEDLPWFFPYSGRNSYTVYSDISWDWMFSDEEYNIKAVPQKAFIDNYDPNSITDKLQDQRQIRSLYIYWWNGHKYLTSLGTVPQNEIENFDRYWLSQAINFAGESKYYFITKMIGQIEEFSEQGKIYEPFSARWLDKGYYQDGQIINEISPYVVYKPQVSGKTHYIRFYSLENNTNTEDDKPIVGYENGELVFKAEPTHANDYYLPTNDNINVVDFANDNYDDLKIGNSVVNTEVDPVNGKTKYLATIPVVTFDKYATNNDVGLGTTMPFKYNFDIGKSEIEVSFKVVDYMWLPSYEYPIIEDEIPFYKDQTMSLVMMNQTVFNIIFLPLIIQSQYVDAHGGNVITSGGNNLGAYYGVDAYFLDNRVLLDNDKKLNYGAYDNENKGTIEEHIKSLDRLIRSFKVSCDDKSSVIADQSGTWAPSCSGSATYSPFTQDEVDQIGAWLEIYLDHDVAWLYGDAAIEFLNELNFVVMPFEQVIYPWNTNDSSESARTASLENNMVTMKRENKFLVIIFLIANFIVILIITKRKVNQDIKKLGTLKALGYKNSGITVGYTLFPLVVVIIGGILGLMIGAYIQLTMIVPMYSAHFMLNFGGYFISLRTIVALIIIPLVLFTAFTLMVVSLTIKKPTLNMINDVDSSKPNRLVKLSGKATAKAQFKTSYFIQSVFRTTGKSIFLFFVIFIVAFFVTFALTGRDLSSNAVENAQENYTFEYWQEINNHSEYAMPVMYTYDQLDEWASNKQHMYTFGLEDVDLELISDVSGGVNSTTQSALDSVKTYILETPYYSEDPSIETSFIVDVETMDKLVQFNSKIYGIEADIDSFFDNPFSYFTQMYVTIISEPYATFNEAEPWYPWFVGTSSYILFQKYVALTSKVIPIYGYELDTINKEEQYILLNTVGYDPSQQTIVLEQTLKLPSPNNPEWDEDYPLWSVDADILKDYIHYFNESEYKSIDKTIEMANSTFVPYDETKPIKDQQKDWVIPVIVDDITAKTYGLEAGDTYKDAKFWSQSNLLHGIYNSFGMCNSYSGLQFRDCYDNVARPSLYVVGTYHASFEVGFITFYDGFGDYKINNNLFNYVDPRMFNIKMTREGNSKPWLGNIDRVITPILFEQYPYLREGYIATELYDEVNMENYIVMQQSRTSFENFIIWDNVVRYIEITLVITQTIINFYLFFAIIIAFMLVTIVIVEIIGSVRRETAILKALGYKNTTISNLTILPYGLVIFLSTLIGMLGTYSILALLTHHYSVAVGATIILTPSFLLLSLVGLMICSLIVIAYVGSLVATHRRHPTESLRADD